MTTEPTNEKKIEQNIEIETPAVEDQVTGDVALSPPPVDDTAVEPVEEKKPAYDDGRAALAAKFKRTREDKEPPVAATGDFTDPAQTYGQVAVEPEPAPQPAPAATPAPAPEQAATFTLKVRGAQREVDRDEAIRLAKTVTDEDDISDLSDKQIARLAQIGAAGQSYLDDTRHVLETSKRAPVSRQHPDETQPAPIATEPDTPDDGTTTADPIQDIVEQIQYGDPAKAAEALRNTMSKVADDAVSKATVTSRVREDITNDLRAYDDFRKKHADLASDPIAVSVIRDGLHDGYREDLLKIGVPAEKIPTDSTQLANHHRHYKLQGQPVRQVATLLDAAHQRLESWRGGGKPRTEPAPTPEPENRLHVSVNRDDRRKAIPQQPTRASVQPSMTQPQSTGPRSRSDAVRAAQRARGQAV